MNTGRRSGSKAAYHQPSGVVSTKLRSIAKPGSGRPCPTMATSGLVEMAAAARTFARQRPIAPSRRSASAPSPQPSPRGPRRQTSPSRRRTCNGGLANRHRGFARAQRSGPLRTPDGPTASSGHQARQKIATHTRPDRPRRKCCRRSADAPGSREAPAGRRPATPEAPRPATRRPACTAAAGRILDPEAAPIDRLPTDAQPRAAGADDHNCRSAKSRDTS